MLGAVSALLAEISGHCYGWQSPAPTAVRQTLQFQQAAGMTVTSRRRTIESGAPNQDTFTCSR